MPVFVFLMAGGIEIPLEVEEDLSLDEVRKREHLVGISLVTKQPTSLKTDAPLIEKTTMENWTARMNNIRRDRMEQQLRSGVMIDPTKIKAH